MPDGEASQPGPTTGSDPGDDKKFTKEEAENKAEEEEFKKEKEHRKNGEATLPTGEGNDSSATGQAGQYTYTDLSELDTVIGAWRTEGDSIRHDGMQFQRATYEISAPTSDVVTTGYFATLSQAFVEITQHNYRMFEYNGNYVDNLSKSRDAISDTDQLGASRYPTA